MKRIQHPSFVRLLNKIVDDTPETSSGTYNRADPTCFSKGSQFFEYDGKRFKFEYNDVTWGIEIEISKMSERFPGEVDTPDKNHPFYWKEEKIAGFYINRDEKFDRKTEKWVHFEEVILRQKNLKGMPGLLVRAFKKCLSPTWKSWKELEFERYAEYPECYDLCPNE